MLKVVSEHYNGFESYKELNFGDDLLYTDNYSCKYNKSKDKVKPYCFFIKSDDVEKKHYLSNSYFIGVDWIVENKKALYIEPKLNDSEIQTDYLKMLFDALKHPEVSNHIDDLFEIKWDKPHIQITQQQDLLTPLLVVQFLKVVQSIVRKGLKKSYYKVENNLYGKVKGKVLVAQTIKQNILKNKNLNTYCSYDEFGLNGLENRLIKKALVFVQRYLPNIKRLNTEAYITGIFNYINPAFEFVSDEVNLHDVKHTKTNSFYKEYEEAIKLAKQILKRFGYNITNTNPNEKIFTPPFWIDMSKLFELYVYAKLIEAGNQVFYQFEGYYGYLDFLIGAKKTIVDAKYKTYYKNNLKGNSYIKEMMKDVRQLSGYSRDINVLGKLNETENTVLNCLIIYPNQESSDKLNENKEEEIDGFVKFKKQSIKLPILKPL